ncbi:DNA segregation ATPase FtsK/SpoIIIE, S-DNA-T family [Micromonospora rhizosphaerae]|uniref:DNA segregation ATPase FtsK/SpoIIIE, S-DNA-T family n=1 Tax=Micromonospora rhizosphaerae TaxID=568872 RepID=A0A1C6RUI0_9ACTN|nr:type VII secretion protein EccCb [Micromonospora rhizosphaerae]SCL20878.1 DNA segregation ATPase FtsK/SpoIIIE, S-DNA-T family [Micromonospora rhizosphaerae]
MGQRRALLIANDRYIDESLADLYAPREEARDLLSLLADADVGAFDQTVLLENESKSSIERAIESMLRAAGPDDLVLLYFSGHGVRSSKRGRLHLAVANTEVDHLSSTAISASFIRELLDESDAASSVLLLDCCYSGAFEGHGLKTTDDLAIDGELRTGYGRYVITATNSVERADDGRPASDTEPRLRSAFTEIIIQGLSTGAADITGQGRITPDDLWRYVHLELPKRSAQTPCQFGSASDEIHIALSRDGQHRQRRRRDQREPRLGDLLGPLEPAGDVKLCATDWRRRGLLKVPVGQAQRIDQPAGEPVWLDLASSEGHLLVVGRAGTGKTTLLRTIIGGLALTHSDDEVAIHCLESGGNWLGPMGRLPHVRTVLGDDEVTEVGKLLDRLEQDVLDRKQLFRRYELESPTSLRARRADLDAGACPDVFLVVDRWQDFATLLPDFTPRLVDLANKGLGYGFHVVVLDRSWRVIPEELRELPQTRIETRLSQPHESLVNPDQAARLPLNTPGWAIHGRRTFRIALPELAAGDREIDPEAEAGTPDGAGGLVAVIAEAWGMPASSAGSGMVRPVAEGLRDELLALFDLPNYAALWSFEGHRTPVGPDHLRVPVGIDETGRQVHLDLKESAQDGMGPHGLVVGATGSGKSELLRTIVLALAARHTSSDLNFLMLDFKGGATFGSLDLLPHTSAIVTNLADDLSLIDRLADGLTGELARRQELLRSAGNFPNRSAYERARAAGEQLEPMPSLLVICDEFSELLAAKPDFIDLFVMIGRLGRSLGVHLLLASQRLEEGKLRGLDTHLSYRIGLRTFSAVESRIVLGVPDAYELPNAPGHGYLKAGAGMTRFRTTYVSGLPAGEAEAAVPPELAGWSLLDIVVDRLRGKGLAAHQIWLPPLADPPSLDELLPPLTQHPDRGLTTAGAAGTLTVPVGVVDVPREQRRAPLLLELAGAGGHVVVVGAPLSGKSTMLRAIVASLALTHTPREVQFFCLDLGGGAMRGLERLPHVSGVAGRRDAEAVRRTVAEVSAVLDAREARFAEHGIESMASYRRRRAAGEFADDRFGDVFLVVDGWSAIRQEYEELEETVVGLAQRGLGFGVHLVLTATRWAEIRIGLRDLLGTKLELRLGDPIESEIDRRTAANVPRSPGRGLAPGKLHFLTALSRIDGRHGVDDLTESTAALADRIAGAWPDASAPPVRLLPRRLSVTELNRLTDPSAAGLPIGVDEAALAPVHLDLDADPHLTVFGDAECGKSNLLRLVARQLVARRTPAQARLVIADYRRSLLGAVEGEHLLGYVVSNQAFTEVLGTVREAMLNRLPGPDVTTEQLRTRTWWKGPDLYLLVDDYDLVATGGSNPLSALHDLLPQARDIGLHLITARRVGGAARALYEPVLQRLRELDSPGLLMSGNREEGALLGGLRPSPMPPGRGTLVRRRDGARVVQTAWSEP